MFNRIKEQHQITPEMTITVPWEMLTHTQVNPVHNQETDILQQEQVLLILRRLVIHLLVIQHQPIEALILLRRILHRQPRIRHQVIAQRRPFIQAQEEDNITLTVTETNLT